MPTTQIEYTTEQGGKWISAEIVHVDENFAHTLDRYAAERMLGEIDPERRVAIELEGGNIVPAAAVRLPSGRVFDAILGCFRDEEKKIQAAIQNTTETPEAVQAAIKYVRQESKRVQK
jgi:porphobilinogen deaminase